MSYRTGLPRTGEMTPCRCSDTIFCPWSLLQPVFLQARHDLDEIARPVPHVELPFQNVVPPVLHRTGRAGQGEEIGATRNAGTGTRLNCRGADGFHADLMENDGEAVDLLLKHGPERFDGDVASCQPGAANRDHYINRGIGGQTTSQMLVRFRQDVIDLQPQVVVILAGTNDIAGNTGKISNDDIETNFATMAELARLHHIRVVFSSILPVYNYTPQSQEFFNSRPMPRIVALNMWLKGYCAAGGCVYLDYFDSMLDAKGMLKRDLADDGLHPNEAGFAVMAPLAEKAIRAALPEK